MANDRPIVEEILDYALYAPLGLALTVVEDLPELVSKGRARIGGQLTVARFVGRLAVGRARRRLDAALAPRETSDQVIEAPAHVAPTPPPHDVPERPRRQAAPPGAESLGIPGYDTLAASQVVARLAGLSPVEREAVRRYEEANRRRRTILTRIAQLEQTRRSR